MKRPTLAFIGMSTFAAPSQALPTRQVEITYFASAAFDREVGYEVRPSCQGTPSPLQGRRTRFAVRAGEACRTGHRSEVACYLDGVRTTCPANICDSDLVTCP